MPAYEQQRAQARKDYRTGEIDQKEFDALMEKIAEEEEAGM